MRLQNSIPHRHSLVTRPMLLPASTNALYTGTPWAPAFLGLLGVFTIVPGLIHYLLPDGGAGVIAGLDLRGEAWRATTIIGVFAWEGATQIAFGFAMVIVALRFRPLTPLFLFLALVEATLQALAEWVIKPGGGPHHPPGSYSVLIAIPLIVVMLAIAISDQRSQSRL